jgi:hypothetical protein
LLELFSGELAFLAHKLAAVGAPALSATIALLYQGSTTADLDDNSVTDVATTWFSTGQL